MTIGEEVLNLLHTDIAFREEVRRQLLTEEVLALPASVRELTEAQRRTEAQVQRQGDQIQQLGEQLQRQGDQLQRQGDQIQRQGDQIQQLVEQLQRQGDQIQRQGDQLQRQGDQLQVLAQSVQALVSWQRGEAGRRDGERYERGVVRRAAVLFNGGQGGSPEQPVVQQRLTAQLGALLRQEILPADADPFLADLVWWKGEQIAVVEASLQVNGEDIRRAAQRAATLRQAGMTALAVVIGEDWVTWEAQQRAQASQVEWQVGAELSEGFLAFRRLPAT